MEKKEKDFNEEAEEGHPGKNKHTHEDDITIEEEENGSGATKKLREKLRVCEKERQEYLDGWQRARADFINSKREHEEAKKELVKFASEEVIFSLLPTLDSFDMAFGNKEAWERVSPEWRKGVEYIYSQMLSALHTHGLVQTHPEGDRFDPNKHVSVKAVAVESDKEDGTIVSVIQRGYELGGKIVRPARVIVGEYRK